MEKSTPLLTKQKCLALMLIAMIGMSIIGTLTGYNIIARAANDTYTVTNVIYFNATTLNPGHAQIFRLEVAQTVPLDDQPDPLGKLEYDVSDRDFAPVEHVTLNQFRSWKAFETFGWDVTENTSYGFVRDTVNGTAIQNLTDYDAWYAWFPVYTFPVNRKQILFDSPQEYVEAYCDEYTLILDSVINSTYEIDIDINSLFGARIVSEYAALGEEPTLGPSQMGTQEWITACFLIFVLFCGWMITEIAGFGPLRTLNAIFAPGPSPLDDLPDETDWIKNNTAEQLAYGLAQYECGNWTLAEYQAFYKTIMGVYDTSMTNAIRNYGTLFDQWLDYKASFGIDFSNLLTMLLTFVCIIIGIYVVISLITRKRK